MQINETKAVKSYFRGNARFGRSTQLVHKTTGHVVIECVGVCTRESLWQAYEYAVERGRMEAYRPESIAK